MIYVIVFSFTTVNLISAFVEMIWDILRFLRIDLESIKYFLIKC